MPNSRYFALAYVNRIGERCGWICGICSGPIDPLLRYPDPASRSVDHILPTQYGGGEQDENLRVAHLCCNTRDGWAWHIGERVSFAEALAWAKEMRRVREPRTPRPARCQHWNGGPTTTTASCQSCW